ncbi:hypothetical protein [Porphyromonas sp. COT-290 OH3588]|nr:hypothetical protein [Porphyromonas sp. COT-290 OH3588]
MQTGAHKSTPEADRAKPMGGIYLNMTRQTHGLRLTNLLSLGIQLI